MRKPAELRGAVEDACAHMDLVRERGAALPAFSERHALTTVELAAVLLAAHKKLGAPKPKAGSALARLLDSGARGSLPFAAHVDFEEDPEAPALLSPGRVRIGAHRVGRLGLGCMRLVSKSARIAKKVRASIGIPHSPEENRHAILNAVRVCGINYVDAARGYGPWPGAGEGLLRDWLAPFPRNLVVATKVGYARNDSGSWRVDLDPRALAAQVDESVRQLGAPIPVVYLVVKSTPQVPVVHRPKKLQRALAPLVAAKRRGDVENIGIANVDEGELLELVDASGGDVAVVQNRFSLRALGVPRERAVLDRCTKLGIPFVAWGIFGEGAHPRPAPPPAVLEAARALRVTPEELTVALLLARADNLVALPGPGRRETIYSSVRGANLRLQPVLEKRLLAGLAG